MARKKKAHTFGKTKEGIEIDKTVLKSFEKHAEDSEFQVQTTFSSVSLEELNDTDTIVENTEENLIGAIAGKACPYNTTGDLGWVKESSVSPYSERAFRVGDKVVPTKLVSYTGAHLKQYDAFYTISSLNGDRAVLSARGQVWAAMNISNLRFY